MVNGFIFERIEISGFTGHDMAGRLRIKSRTAEVREGAAELEDEYETAPPYYLGR
jgi:hypothetical protein